MKFDALGLDVDDDEAREIANDLYQLLLDAGHDVEGVAPILNARYAADFYVWDHSTESVVQTFDTNRAAENRAACGDHLEAVDARPLTASDDEERGQP